MTRGERARSLFEQGYNCAQSVVLAFDDLPGFDRELMTKTSLCLGGGVSRLREVCGAVLGMAMIEGLVNSPAEPCTREQKGDCYALTQELARDFNDKFGSVVCRELLGLPDGFSEPEPTERTADFYKVRPCGAFIEYMADRLGESIDSLSK